MTYQIADLVDTDAYPLDRPDDPAIASLLAKGRAALKDNALFRLPGFVRPHAAEVMASELQARIPQSVRYDRPRIAYYEDGQDWPEDHARSLRHDCSYHQVLNHQIPNGSPLRQLYVWQPLTDFLGQIMGYETFHRSECPHLAMTAKIAGPGDTDGWHFDGNDVVFSILLQAPDAGGQFEYAPYIRSETDENYGAVADAMQDRSDAIRQPPMQPGDLTVFKGDASLHRVTPVEGDRRRIVALFCYDQQPGTCFEQAYIEELTEGLAA